MKTLREPCGCTFERNGERERWAKLCPTHDAEATERHTRAQREHAEAMARFNDRPGKENRA